MTVSVQRPTSVSETTFCQGQLGARSIPALLVQSTLLEGTVAAGLFEGPGGTGGRLMMRSDGESCPLAAHLRFQTIAHGEYQRR
jgi:hypothetical protein